MGGALSSPRKDEMNATGKAKGSFEVGIAANLEGACSKKSPAFVLPEEEYFLSVVLVPGCSRSSFRGAYWRSKSRRNHLRWALHRGIEHGCQPCMFWRTVFVEEPSRSSARPLAHDLEITRYLSQFAFDFVFGRNSREGEKLHVVIYIVSPDREDLLAQVDLIRQIWDEASIVGVKPVCVVLEKQDFDERVLCHPPRMLVGKEALASNGSEQVTKTTQSDSDKKGEVAVSVEQIASLRGAGLLYGYPSFVFNCNPSSLNGICSDEKGKIIGSAGGCGLSPKLEELLTLSDCTEESGEFCHRITRFDANFVETGQEVELALGEKAGEILDNARAFVSYWTYVLNVEAEDRSTKETRRAADDASLQRMEWIVAAMDNMASGNDDDQEGIELQKTPMFDALYQRRNKKRSVVISGVDSDLLSSILDTNKASSNAAITFNALTQKISGEDGALHFPWNDSPAASCWYEEMETEVSYSSPRQVCPIQKNLHLAHFGVTASVMGHYITARISTEIIGRRVAKRFINPEAAKQGGAETQLGEIYRGYLAKVEEKGGEDWYYIRYDDGDTEHVARPELIQMIDRYDRVGEDGKEENVPVAMKTATTITSKGKKRLASGGNDKNCDRNDAQSSLADGSNPTCKRSRRQRHRQMPLCRDGVYHFF